MKNKILASIDIGTNTFRLLIARVSYDPRKNNYTIEDIFSERTITRLGDSIHDNGRLKNEAMDRGIQCLRKFSRTISKHNVYKTAAIATSALRDAKNGEQFLIRAMRESGLEIKIISGNEEAKITASGMMIDMAMPDSALMLDIGGGSTELIFVKNQRPLSVKSLNLGVVYLAGKYMKNDPPPHSHLQQMEQEVHQKIKPAVQSFKPLLSKDSAFIGTAGTITTLAATVQNLKSFDHARIHNFQLTINNVRNIYSSISNVSSMDRAKLMPYEPSRLDIIVPGTLILLKLMKAFDFKTIKVSNHGLREGNLIELYKNRS